MAAPKEQSQTNKNPESDDELNDLLDSALQDLNDAKSKEKPPTQPNPVSESGDSNDFTEQFSDDLAREFEEAMKGFFDNDPGMMQQIEKLAEAAGTIDESAEEEKKFGETLKEALDGLVKNTEELQEGAAAGGAGAGGADDFMKMFSGMGLDAGAQEDAFMPLMQNMMKTLLSRDVLYPSLKEISEKYPNWLKENKDKIADNEYNKYSKQRDIINNILEEFDQEKASDTPDEKNKRFEKIMDLMQRMQDLGQPPKDIVGDVAPGLEFDANGVPKFPTDACSIM